MDEDDLIFKQYVSKNLKFYTIPKLATEVGIDRRDLYRVQKENLLKSSFPLSSDPKRHKYTIADFERACKALQQKDAMLKADLPKPKRRQSDIPVKGIMKAVNRELKEIAKAC